MTLEFVQALESSADLYRLTGVSVERIKLAEELLNVEFTNEYKEYLSAFGVASANAHEFTGICQSPRLNVVDV